MKDLYLSTKLLNPFVFTKKEFNNINKYYSSSELYIYDNVSDNLFIDCDISYK
jgi:hypothetical protein